MSPPPSTQEETLEELEFTEAELDRVQRQSARVEATNEALRDENARLLIDLETIKTLYDQSLSNNAALGSKLLGVQCEVAHTRASLDEARRQLERQRHVPSTTARDERLRAEMGMARQIIVSLEAQCQGYEARIAKMQTQLSKLTASLHAKRRAR